ncbi:MAG: M15 family metallopeptidase [Bacilli bacterium]|nr:M15 family metallopeptidase [Bacilli bacterium]
MKKRKLQTIRQRGAIYFVILGAIILVALGIKNLIYMSTTEYKLKKIGYSSKEVTVITEKLNNEEINPFLKQDYNSYLSQILNATYYIDDNLDRYLTYAENNSDKSITDVVSIVNTYSDYEFYSNIVESDVSKGNLIIVNKHYQLPDDYEPDNLVAVKNWYAYGTNELKEEVYDAFLSMYNDATKKDLKLIIISGYRSYDEQEVLFDSYKNSNGQTWADSIAARAGHSEHQTGLTFDLTTTGISDIDDFQNTDEFTWMQENSYKYGFILRYPEGKEGITGYDYESWHYRYVGVEVATVIHTLNITFDEYYEYFVK